MKNRAMRGFFYSLPCDGRGGSGWGCLGFSTQLNVATDGKKLYVASTLGLRARYARTPP